MVDVKTVKNEHIFFSSVFMNYFDNPGGMIPTWLVNWAAKVSAHMFLLLYLIFLKWIQTMQE